MSVLSKLDVAGNSGPCRGKRSAWWKELQLLKSKLWRNLSHLRWVITLIEQFGDKKFFRQRELFWAHKLYNFYPNGLNHREIYAA